MKTRALINTAAQAAVCCGLPTWCLQSCLLAAALFSCFGLLSLACAAAYPAPAGLRGSADYEVSVQGQPVFVHGTPAFSMASFAISGEAEVTVRVKRPIKSLVIRPLRLGLKGAVAGDTVRFVISHPCRLCLEPDDDLRRPLFLFADAPQTDPPRPDEPKVRFFAGGIVHEPGEIVLRDHETVYLAGGAVVRGTIRAEGVEGARVLGPGILDATTRTNKAQMVVLTGCRDIEFDGPIVLGSYGWTLVARQSENVRFRNVKVVSWRDNDDGLDIVSSRRVEVDGCFFRTKDDCVSVKAQGGRPFGYEIAGDSVGARLDVRDGSPYDVREVRVRNSVFWNAEWGNALEIGFELRGPRISDIVFENCDIIREEKGAVFSIHNGDFAQVEQVRFQDIRVEVATGKLVDLVVGLSIYSEDCPKEFSRTNPRRKAPPGGGPWLRLGEDQRAEHAKHRGSVGRVEFKNITLCTSNLPPSVIRGYGPGHEVGEVRFQQLTWNGQPIRSAAEARLTAEHAENISFEP